ncbi:MAG: flagellar filament capping protein FliD [Limnochordales bacterium]
MHISGIVSGLDTDTLIEQLMAIERRPLVLMQERKTTLEKQRDAWRDVNTRLNNLRDRMAELSRLSLFERRAVTSSKAEVATATANRNAVEAVYRISVQQLAAAHRVAGKRFETVDGKAAPKEPLGLSGEARLRVGQNGDWITVAVDAADTLESIAAKINEAAGGAVIARVLDGRLILEAKETGAANTLEFEVPGGSDPSAVNIWQELGVVDDAGEILNELQAAQDAVFTVEGLTITRSSNTVDDLIEGVTLQLKGVGETTLEIRRDVDAVVDAVRRFVEQYNSTMSFIQDRMGENGVLKGDTLLMRIQMQLRADVMAPVAATGLKYNQLAAVGISVDKSGTMSLDEARLREALGESPEEVARLFTASKEDGDPFDGVAIRLEQRFQQWLAAGDGLLAARQKLFGDRIKAIEDSMDRFEQRMEIREANLRRQFLALEEALASLQTQSNWLANQLVQLSAMASAIAARNR